MINPISMRNFKINPYDNPINIVKTGKMDIVLAEIEKVEEIQDQLNAYMACLSQTLSMKGDFKGKCQSMLEERIFALAKVNRDEAQALINRSDYKYDPNLTQLIQRVNYVTCGMCGIHNRVTNYAKKLVCQIINIYGNNKYGGTTYFLAGAGVLLAGGISEAFSIGTTDYPGTGWIYLGAGALGMSLPMFLSIGRAFGDDPN